MKRIIVALLFLSVLGTAKVEAHPHHRPEPTIYNREPEIVVDSRQIKDREHYYGVSRIQTPHGWLVITTSGIGTITTYVPDEYHTWKLTKPYNAFDELLKHYDTEDGK